MSQRVHKDTARGDSPRFDRYMYTSREIKGENITCDRTFTQTSKKESARGRYSLRIFIVMFRQKYRRVRVPREALAIVNSRGDCHNKRDDRAGVTANRESRDNKRMKEEDGRDGFRQTHIWPSFLLSLSLHRRVSCIWRDRGFSEKTSLHVMERGKREGGRGGTRLDSSFA